MERQAGKKFFSDKKVKNAQIAFTIKPEILYRIDKLRIGMESRSSVIRRLVDVGLLKVEEWAKLEASQVRLSPISEDER